MKNEKGSAVLILIVLLVIVAAVFGGIYFLKPKASSQAQIVPQASTAAVAPSTNSDVQEINSLDDGSSSDSDVNSVNSDLQNL